MKKLYWLVESNGDLSITETTLENCKYHIQGDFESLPDDEKAETKYTVTPTFLTEEEYNALPEA